MSKDRFVKEKLAIREAEVAYLKSQLNKVNGESRDKDARLAQLEAENGNLRQWIANIEQSTSWKITKPIRLVLDKLKRS